MSIKVKKGSQFVGSATNGKIRAAAGLVIQQLQYADIWQGQGTLHEDDNGTCRLDMQGVIQTNPPQHNLQVQLNKGKGYNPKKSTIATALVSESLQTQGPMNRNVVVNTVRTALGTSLKDGYIYIVDGTVP